MVGSPHQTDTNSAVGCTPNMYCKFYFALFISTFLFVSLSLLVCAVCNCFHIFLSSFNTLYCSILLRFYSIEQINELTCMSKAVFARVQDVLIFTCNINDLENFVNKRQTTNAHTKYGKSLKRMRLSTKMKLTGLII